MLVERILHASLRHTRQKNQERMFERKMRHRNFQFSHVIGRWNRAKCCIPKLGIIGLEKNCRNLFFKMKLYFYPTDLETNITIHFFDVSFSSYFKNTMIVPIFSMSLFPSESLASESRTTFVLLSTLVIPPHPRRPPSSLSPRQAFSHPGPLATTSVSASSRVFPVVKDMVCGSSGQRGREEERMWPPQWSVFPSSSTSLWRPHKGLHSVSH